MTRIIRTLIFPEKDRFNISDLAFFSGMAWLFYHEKFWWYIPLTLAYFATMFVLEVARVTKIGKEILKETTND